VTAGQLALGDCDPDWAALDQLCDLGAEDLRGQRITKRQYHRMQTITPDRRYL
jgi:hypothetical protein